ncbi:MAG TPA: acetyl-CoA C-acyltransferase [Burkholderiales bacterium]|nr:acetyl-CoA C-acyltransferase [Burkholderiales bacterium]
MSKSAYIIDAVRTPIGRHSGVLARVRPDDLAAHAIKATIARSGVDPMRIDDVILGCANQAGEDNRNVARMAALLADLPVEIAGQTVNRLCGSGLQAVNAAAQAIAAGAGDIIIAGGVESMSRAPYAMLKAEEGFARGAPAIADTVLGWRFINPRLPDHWTIGLGETAENIAEKYHITREAQDEFALRSQRNAGAAARAGRFFDEIVNVELTGRKGEKSIINSDEHPRPETSMEQLARLRPAFREGGTVTAGNSSGLNDGAAALTLVSEERLNQMKAEPLARVVASAVAGVQPHFMGLGPVPATQKALQRAGLQMKDLVLIEMNEAFAAQCLGCMRDLDVNPDIVNVNGGAIALGHPLGCSGARIMTTLVHELRRRGGGYGLATMCIGVGQGISTVVEVFPA